MAPNVSPLAPMTSRWHDRRMRVGLLVLLLSLPASAAPLRDLGGERVPVLSREPTFERGTFVAPAGSQPAQKYRALLATRVLDKFERDALKRDTLPPGQFLVRVWRDKRGKPYLYKPCDYGYHQRILIGHDEVILLGVEPLAVPITRKTSKGRVTTIDLDTAGLPPMESSLSVRSTKVPGMFELAGEDDAPGELLGTPDAIAKLDVVVRVCKNAKTHELDFKK